MPHVRAPLKELAVNGPVPRWKADAGEFIGIQREGVNSRKAWPEQMQWESNLESSVVISSAGRMCFELAFADL